MENHLFLWLRNRTTDNRKCEKARNIKEKRTIGMFNTVSSPHVVLHSSQRDNHLSKNLYPEDIILRDFLCTVGPRSKASAVAAKNMPQAYFLNVTIVLKEIITYQRTLFRRYIFFGIFLCTVDPRSKASAVVSVKE